MKRTGTASRALVTALALGLAAGGAAADETKPQRGGTLNVATMYAAIDALSWNPLDWSWKSNHDMLNLDHLIMGDLDKSPGGTNEYSFVAQDYIPDDIMRGDLAESWDVKQDPLRIEFKLRQGVMWPAVDGVMASREVVAEDVIQSFKRMQESTKYIPTYYDFVKEWKAPDKHTVVAELAEWNANWAYHIGYGYYSGIVPPEVFALNGGKGPSDPTQVVGSGAFKISEIVKGSRHVYTANDLYWDKARIGGEPMKLPMVETLVLHIMKDEATRLAALRSGQIDILEWISWQYADELKASAPDLIMKEDVSTVGTYVALRTDQKPFDDLRVRQAMNLAVNQQEILDAVLDGHGEVLHYPLTKRNGDLYTPVDQLPAEAKLLFDYDPERAKKLLAEAGYPNGFEFDVMYSTSSPYHSDLIPLLQSYYEAIGVKLNAQPLEYAAFRSQMRKDTQSAGYLMDNSEGNPPAVLRKTFKTGQTWNPSFFSDPKFDAMYDALVQEQDQTKRDQMIRDASNYIIAQAPHVWLPTQSGYRAWWPWVKNYNGELRVGAVRPGPIYARVWIDQEMKKKMGF